MKTLRAVRRLVLLTIAVLVLCGASAAHAAIPDSWKDTGFSIDPAGMTLRGVLEQFGQVYGVRVEFDVQDVGMSRERLRSDSGIEFLNRLAQPYRFRWFVYAGALHIVRRDDNASVRLEVGEDAVQDAKGALIGMGLFDERFGWGELPDEGIVIISGPREYVRLAREILMPDGEKAAKKDRQIMVFRLKYASATDRIISARGRNETIPGIKTILSGLLFGEAQGGLDTPSDRFDAGSTKRSRKPDNGPGQAREVGFGGLGLAANRSVADVSAPREPKKSTSDSSRKDGPRIEADPSLNAIIIYDELGKREMYQSLIDQLDVQPQQIEIEALIVDIDRSKLSELGVEWGIRSGNGNVVGRVNAMRDESQDVSMPLPGSTLLISNAARFYARLKALEGKGEARILATPTVLTLDNVAAVLDLSQTLYMPLLGERYADLADITAGTMLRVIPRIVKDGASTRVRLEVDIEDGALGDSTSQANVTRSTISTQAIIDLQQTLMIGGYRAESLSTHEQKVPGLGDVPLFGGLFRSHETTSGSRERLFLITPRLLASSGTAAHPVSHSRQAADRHAAAVNPVEPAQPEPRAEPAPVEERSVAAAPGATIGATVEAEAAMPAASAAKTPVADVPPAKNLELKMASSFKPAASSASAPVAPRARRKCGPPAPGFRSALAGAG